MEQAREMLVHTAGTVVAIRKESSKVHQAVTMVGVQVGPATYIIELAQMEGQIQMVECRGSHLLIRIDLALILINLQA